eukprot:scaffold196268_cov52-Attheya_sp.AAC.2
MSLRQNGSISEWVNPFRYFSKVNQQHKRSLDGHYLVVPATDYEWKRVLAAYRRELDQTRMADEWENRKRKTD